MTMMITMDSISTYRLLCPSLQQTHADEAGEALVGRLHMHHA